MGAGIGRGVLVPPFVRRKRSLNGRYSHSSGFQSVTRFLPSWGWDMGACGTVKRLLRGIRGGRGGGGGGGVGGGGGWGGGWRGRHRHGISVSGIIQGVYDHPRVKWMGRRLEMLDEPYMMGVNDMIPLLVPTMVSLGVRSVSN